MRIPEPTCVNIMLHLLIQIQCRPQSEWPFKSGLFWFIQEISYFFRACSRQPLAFQTTFSSRSGPQSLRLTEGWLFCWAEPFLWTILALPCWSSSCSATEKVHSRQLWSHEGEIRIGLRLNNWFKIQNKRLSLCQWDPYLDHKCFSGSLLLASAWISTSTVLDSPLESDCEAVGVEELCMRWVHWSEQPVYN